MTIELLIAPPAAGKTETCINKIRAVLIEYPLTPVWTVVPDRPLAFHQCQLIFTDLGKGSEKL